MRRVWKTGERIVSVRKVKDGLRLKLASGRGADAKIRRIVVHGNSIKLFSGDQGRKCRSFMSIIRNDYKGGPEVRPEQIRWEEAVFGSPEAVKAFRSPTPLRRFVQIGARVNASGRFVAAEDIEFHMMWDRKRTTFFKSVRGDARALETMAVTAVVTWSPKYGMEARSDVQGASWFDFSNRPYSGGQSCRSVQMRREEFLPDWYTGKNIGVKISVDGKNVDILDTTPYENVIFRMVGADVLMPGSNVAIELPLVTSHGVDPREFNLGEVYKFRVDRNIPVAKANRPSKWMVTDWDHSQGKPKPLTYGPTSRDRSTLDLRFENNRKRVADFCDIYSAMTRVAFNKGLMPNLETPEDWMPIPYLGFRSMDAFERAVSDPELRPTQEIVEQFRLDSSEAGLLPVHRFREPGKIISATETVGSQIRLSFENGRSVVLPKSSRYCLTLSNAIFQITNLEDFANKYVATGDVVNVETAPQFFVDAASMRKNLGETVTRSLVQTKLRDSLVSALSSWALPATLIASMPDLAAASSANIIFDVSPMRTLEEPGLFLSPPIYIDAEPQEFRLRGVSFFNGIPTEYRVYRGLIPDKKKLEKAAAAELLREQEKERKKNALKKFQDLTSPAPPAQGTVEEPQAQASDAEA